MLRSCIFYRFPVVLEWILGGLGKVLGVFWRWFFTRLKKKSIFKKIAFSLEKTDKFKGLGYEKSMKKTMEIHSNFALKQNSEKIA